MERKNGLKHRDNDLPAIENADGTKEWYQNGKLHRDNDLPAIEKADGTKEWYQNGKFYKDNHLSLGGSKKWWQTYISSLICYWLNEK